jgi:hypothetical protein
VVAGVSDTRVPLMGVSDMRVPVEVSGIGVEDKLIELELI